MKLRTLLKFHGGKNYLSPWLITNCPTNVTKMELYDIYGGAGTFLARMPKCIKETYNDIDPELYNLFNNITNPELLIKISKIEYTKENFDYYLNNNFTDNLDRAIKEIVIRRMSRGGLMKTFSYSNRLRGGQCGDVNSWQTWIKDLPKFVKRFENVIILNKNAKDIIIENINNTNAFFFLDPPYLSITRTAKKTYRNEMTENQHIEMLEILKESESKIMLCGYYSELYKNHLNNWNMKTKTLANNSSQNTTKDSRVECIWLNY